MMVSFAEAASFVLHLDSALAALVQEYGVWVYAIVFAIIFLETGIVVTPFLPGDSLLFAAGAIAALGDLNVLLLLGLIAIAAILGDAVNYSIGYRVGRRAFTSSSRFLNKDHLHKAEKFYAKYGAKTIVIARFVPIVRTFAPFVAGIARMKYHTFAMYNVVGALVWTGIFVLGGYFLGNLAIVQDNFSLFIVLIIVGSLVPVAFEYWRHKRAERKAASAPE